MRLLELDSADTPLFSIYPGGDCPFYAILSHTWGADEDEVTFNDIQSGSGKGKRGYKKIQFCGRQARRDGLRFFWVDTCSINKPDYTELSEAVNSMFRWYREATKCYVYLSDVSIHDQDDDSSSERPWEAAFRKSRWFTRGWTLQELLAPRSVDFFSREGEHLGDRNSLVEIIHEITSIPIPALQGTPLSHFSNDEKMRWAVGRHTKKIEDKAYSLLGIFSVFIPLIYGEGDNAFSRLEQEINKHNGNETNGPVWHVPFDQTSEFVGRQDELRKVKQTLFETKGGRIISVLGLGGVGKSRFALELVSEIKSNYSHYSIFWVQATNQLTFEKSILEIGKRLQIPGIEDEKADIKTLVKQWLSNSSGLKWLLILDNADDESLWGKPLPSQQNDSLVDYLPRTTNGAILVTTRTTRVASFLAAKEVVELRALSAEEAGKMFLNRLEVVDSAEDRTMVLSLVLALTCLPLAIVQAASFINMARESVKTYLELLEKPEADVIRLLSEDFGDESRYPDAKNPIAATWLISFEHIRQKHPLAAEVFSRLVCFQESNIPSSLLLEVGSKVAIVKAIGVLKGYSFITARAASSDTPHFQELYDMHRLVRLAARSWLQRDGSFASWNKTCVIQIAQIFPTSDHTNKPLWTILLPHARSLCEDSVEDLHERYKLLENIGWCLLADGKYSDAVKMFYIVVQWSESTFGNNNNIMKLGAYYGLGEALNANGDWITAERYLQQAYHGYKQTLSQEHPNTLKCMTNLATTFRYQGQYKKTEELEIQVLEIRKRVLGKEHPDTLTSMGNLALTFGYQGQYKKAEELGIQVLEIRKRVLGKEHPDTLIGMGNLASTFRYQGQYKKAEELGVQVLEIRKRVLGKEHPDTLISMGNLALTFRCQGQYKKAEELGIQVLEIRKRVLGEEHPDTLTSMGNLAFTLKHQGRNDEATELMASCLELRLNVLGSSHPHTQYARAALMKWSSAANAPGYETEIATLRPTAAEKARTDKIDGKRLIMGWMRKKRK